MEIRGERECQSCGTRWSYYRTGSVECPSCGSLRSVGVDERTRHTDSAAALDLDEARRAAAADRYRESARAAAEAARAYVAARGFVHAGALRDLDDDYLAAAELRSVGGRIARGLALDEAVERYYLAVLDGAGEGTRPDPSSVPQSVRDARGLAVASSVGDYRRELRLWIDDAGGDPARDHEASPDARAALDRLDDHVRRVEALDGDVAPAAVERLVEAVRALATCVREADADALATAEAHLDRLDGAT